MAARTPFRLVSVTALFIYLLQSVKGTNEKNNSKFIDLGEYRISTVSIFRVHHGVFAFFDQFLSLYFNN